MSPSLGNEVSAEPRDIASTLIPEVGDVFTYFSGLIALAKERLDGELGGKLLLYGRLDARGAAVALAANIAGVATLGVDADSDRLRQGIRHGFCDFVVNHLDEALRILKNEVRKKQPVSVCLEGDLASTLSEAVERGFQPDLLARIEQSAAVESLIERGAIVFGHRPVQETQREAVTWTAASAPARWLPQADALAAQVLPAGDERSHWLRLAPRYLGRTMAAEHFLPMTSEEADQFAKLLSDAMASGSMGTRITIQRRQPLPPQR